MDDRPILLDWYSCQGGAAKGYADAGFRVIGFDINPQPRYPFEFYQHDFLNGLPPLPFAWSQVAAIHASPPCQHFSVITPVQHRDKHLNLIPHTRALLRSLGLPYVIENVPNARKHLINPIMLCGSSFGLGVFRHRYFELGNGFDIDDFKIPPCRHDFKPVYLTGSTGSSKSPKGTRKDASVAAKRAASGCTWMNTDGLDEAIPPAFTEFIGRQLMTVVQAAHHG